MDKKFEDIIGKLSPTLRRITYKLNGHFTFFDEDDLFQEALEHLWLAYQNDTLRDKTDSYILQGCYFHLKNYIRKTMDKVKLTSINALPDDEEGHAIEETLASPAHDTEDALEGVFLEDAVRASGLSERERRVLALSLDGLTVREIGLELSISHVMVIKIKKKMMAKWEALKKRPLKSGYQN